jgi:hypothetical protein
MSSFHLPRIAELDESAIARFREQGYLVVERVLDAGRIAELRDRFPKLFAGQFDTGVYPDEWYWREGMSLPDVTRHMANAWKSDLSVARLALSKDVGRVRVPSRDHRTGKKLRNARNRAERLRPSGRFNRPASGTADARRRPAPHGRLVLGAAGIREHHAAARSG